jgi:acid phosphatase (class A)
LPRAFSCAAGVTLSAETTPTIHTLMRRAAADLSLSTNAVKAAFQRERPFMSNGAPICTPDWEAVLRGNGSYPSGHSATGFGIGLVLAEVFPDRASALVARGRAYGQSRVVCNVHWLSDVEEGRVIAAATVARLHADPGFAADLARAREEAAALPRAVAPADCAAEAAALAEQ